jgi:hypothetical protein
MAWLPENTLCSVSLGYNTMVGILWMRTNHVCNGRVPFRSHALGVSCSTSETIVLSTTQFEYYTAVTATLCPLSQIPCYRALA